MIVRSVLDHWAMRYREAREQGLDLEPELMPDAPAEPNSVATPQIVLHWFGSIAIGEVDGQVVLVAIVVETFGQGAVEFEWLHGPRVPNDPRPADAITRPPHAMPAPLRPGNRGLAARKEAAREAVRRLELIRQLIEAQA